MSILRPLARRTSIVGIARSAYLRLLLNQRWRLRIFDTVYTQGTRFFAGLRCIDFVVTKLLAPNLALGKAHYPYQGNSHPGTDAYMAKAGGRLPMHRSSRSQFAYPSRCR